MLTEYLAAYSYELEAAGRVATKRVGRTGDAMSEGASWLGRTKAATVVGDSAVRVARVVSKLPIVTWQADLMAARHGTDSLQKRFERSLQDEPESLVSALLAVQLAEASARMRRERTAVRAAMLFVNPVSTGASMAVGASLKVSGKEPATKVLVTYAHAAVSQSQHCFETQLLVARTFLAAGKPGRAARAALLATLESQIEPAGDKAEPSSTVRSAFRSLRERDAGAVKRLATDPYGRLSREELGGRRLGAALYFAGLAYRELDDDANAWRCALLAEVSGNTMGLDLQARLLPNSRSSLRDRAILLKGVKKADRRFIQGTARKDVATMAGTVSGQTKRTASLIAEIGRAFAKSSARLTDQQDSDADDQYEKENDGVTETS